MKTPRQAASLNHALRLAIAGHESVYDDHHYGPPDPEDMGDDDACDVCDGDYCPGAQDGQRCDRAGGEMA